MAHGYGWSAPILLALLDEMQDRYRVDPDRIHVTGFSMGGYGTWGLACLAPERFASAAVLCGRGDVEAVDKIKDLPQWVVHGKKDGAIPIEASKQMVEGLEKVGAKDVRFIVRMSRQICGVVSDLPRQRLCRSQTTYQTNGSFLGV